MSTYHDFFLSSSLEKVFPARRPPALPPQATLSGFADTVLNLQLVHFFDCYDCFSAVPQLPEKLYVRLENCPFAHAFYEICEIPSDMPSFEDADNYFISKTDESYPDFLRPSDGALHPAVNEYRSLWISLSLKGALPGRYPIHIVVEQDGEERYRATLCVRVCTAPLEKQKLIHTEWLHADCLCSYYNVEAFSERHFALIENFIRAAVQDYGINMILTPVFTPPLDTQVGGERRTVQLVDIACDSRGYHFDFSNLARWADICKRCGVEYLEIAHLFTQWGAQHCPKIIVTEKGRAWKKFGWQSDAAGTEYRKFLEQFLPALRSALQGMGYPDEKVYYHISDEPSEDNLEHYRRAKAQVADLLEGANVVDALSSYRFYQEGLVTEPIVSSDHIQAFLDAGVPNLWVYYCCGQDKLVPNRFFAMPSPRNRVFGVLLYLSGVKGFLHWGYNFYNSQYSLSDIDPYTVSDADCGFPSGDAYLVYPGEEGEALPSIRGKVLAEAIVDLRACETLEKYRGRDYVQQLIKDFADMQDICYTKYPRSAEFLLSLRERLAEELERAVQA